MKYTFYTLHIPMNDQQFQPWQPTPPVQWGGVFWGTFVEEEHHEDAMFGPLEEIEKKQEQTPASPFWAFQEVDTQSVPQPETQAVPQPTVSENTQRDGYSMPQYTTPSTSEVTTTTDENPADFQISWEPSTPVEEIGEQKEVEAVSQEISEAVPAEETSEEIAPVETPEEEIALETVSHEETDQGIPATHNEIEEVSEKTVSEEETYEEEDEETPVLSDIQEKFTSLLENVSALHEMLSLENWETLEIIWANNDDFSILYHFSLNEQYEIRVKRIETQKQSNETSFNELKLWINPESNFFELFLDDVLLYEESELLQDAKKKSQVIEKINKLIFLSESKIKDIQKEMRAKQQEEDERRRLNDIFRDF